MVSAANCRIQSCAEEETVCSTAPTPVEVEIIALIAVAHEGVAGCNVLTAIYYGAVSVNLSLNDFIPCLLSCNIRTLFVRNAGIVTEVGRKSSRYANFIGA